MKKKNKVRLVWGIIILCFLLIGSPLILYLDSLNLLIFGIPPVYAFVFFVWLLLCLLTFIGYSLRWGEEDDSDGPT